jgi:hypothetical protein
MDGAERVEKNDSREPCRTDRDVTGAQTIGPTSHEGGVGGRKGAGRRRLMPQLLPRGGIEDHASDRSDGRLDSNSLG